MSTVCVKVRVNRQGSKGLHGIVSLPLDKLSQTSFYGGLLSCYYHCQQDNTILPFPTQHSQALPHYLDYCHHNNKIKVRVRKLKLCFDLAHYLGDDGFFQALVQCLVRSWPTSNTVIEQCTEPIQRQIYLSLPLMFVTECYRYDDKFVNQWNRLNLNKRITGPYDANYRTVIDLSVITMDKWNFASSQLMGFSSSITYPDDHRIYDHGFKQSWYPPDSNSKQYLNSETSYFYDKKFGLHREWYKTGRLFKEIEYDIKGVVIKLRMLDVDSVELLSHDS